MEWRNRNGLDMTLRLYSSLLVAVLQAVLQAVLMAVEGKEPFVSVYDLHSDYSYWRGVGYGVLLIVAELVYFGSLWLYHWYRNRYDIFSPFTLYVMGMGTGHRAVMLLTFLSAVVPSLFQ